MTRERSLSLVLGIILCVTGISGWLVSDDMFPETIDVFILIGPKLTLSNITGPQGKMIRTHILTPPHDGGGSVFAMIEITNDDDSEIVEAESASATIHDVSKGIVMESHAVFGYVTNPLENRRDVHLGNEQIRFRILVGQHGSETVVWDVQGKSVKDVEGFVSTLDDVEMQNELTPPYNLTCVSWIQYDIRSDVDEARNQHSATCWNLEVREDSSLVITKYADIPIHSMKIMNFWIKILKQANLLLLMLGMALLALSAYQMRSLTAS